ncbi:MAG: chemotaxis protein CheW [Nitrospirae bacterium]|nr:chemotaxis protein CheW [Nitrospirota bacterium]
MEAIQEAQDQETEFDVDLLQLVTFRMDDEEYAVDILKVQEIIKTMEITRVPKAPHFVEGVVNLRGKVIPIVNLRKRLGMPIMEHTQDSRIIVVDVQGKLIGILVDAVSEVLRLSSRSMESAPSLERKARADYILGVGKFEDRLIVHLDLEKLFKG